MSDALHQCSYCFKNLQRPTVGCQLQNIRGMNLISLKQLLNQFIIPNFRSCQK